MRGVMKRCARGYVSTGCFCASARAFSAGAPHPSPIGDTFPSRGRLHCATKFHRHNTGYAFEDVRFRGHVAQVRQKVLSDFSKKFLRREISFRAPPGEGSPSLRLRRKFTHSCALRTQREFSRSAERDQRLCLWNPRAFEKARSKLWSLGRIAILRQHNMDKPNSCRIDVGNISVCTCKTS